MIGGQQRTPAGPDAERPSSSERAAAAIGLVEWRVAYMQAQSRRAVARFVLGKTAPPDPDDARDARPALPLRLTDFERWAHHWAALVPTEPAVCAELARQLGRRYGEPDGLPGLRAALRLEDAAVRQRYQQRSGGPGTAPAGPIGGQPVQAGQDGDDALLDDLGAELEWVLLEQGARLFSEGEPSDCLFIVISGRLRVTVRLPDGQERVVGEVARGETVGEMGLLSGEPRSASVYAIRDTELVRLSQAGFERVVEQHPRLMMGVTRLLVTRLQRSIHATRAPNSVATIAIVPSAGGLPAAELAARLAAALARYGPTLRVNRALVEQECGPDALVSLESGVDRARLVGWLSDQETRYRFVLLEADATVTPWTRHAARQADRVLIVADPVAQAGLRSLQSELVAEGPTVLTARQDLVVVHRHRTERPTSTAALLASGRVSAHYHVALDSDAQVQSLARRLVGQAVGLVLGSGGARGFAHIGVARALREAGVPIDLVGGTSAGSLVGAWLVAGWDDAAMIEAARDLARRARELMDYTVPVVSLLAAGRFTDLLTQMFGDLQIEDLWTTYFCASSNLSRAQLMLHQNGPLRQAIRASCSLPGVLPPVTYQGQLLADGVLLESLPVDAMARLADGGPVIAVDVSAEVDLAHEFEFGERLSGLRLLWNRYRPFRRQGIRAPSIMSVMARAAELSSVRTRLAQAEKVSLYLAPPVSHFGLFEAGGYERIVELGYRAAVEALPGWLEGRSF